MGLEGILKGSAAIKDAIEKGPKGQSRFLKLTDGESVTIRFLQELDETGKNYDEGRGQAIAFYEHMDPDDFSTAFKCTADSEGMCAGCERVPTNKKWRAKGRMLANVVVRGADKNDEVKIFSTGLSQKGLAPQLIDFSNDYGSLCDRDYKMTRRGEKLNTTYTLLPRDVSAFTKSDKEHELIDLNELVRSLTYAEQKELLSGEKSDW